MVIKYTLEDKTFRTSFKSNSLSMPCIKNWFLVYLTLISGIYCNV